jgi:hypothetical protein
VAGVGQAGGDLSGQGMGEGLRVVMTDDDQGMHGGLSKIGMQGYPERYILKVSYV